MTYPSEENRHLITVVIPVYNGEKNISQALKSVLNQSYKNLEIIVVDDGSTDSTKEIVNGFNDSVTYLYQENAGPASARNTGIKYSKGDFISFLDADDLWHAEKLKKQLLKFHEHDSLDIALGFFVKGPFTSLEDKCLKDLIKAPQFSLSLGSALIRRDAFDKIGLLDEELIMAEDLDWFYRAREMTLSICIHRDIVQYYRRHDTNLTNDKKKAVFNYLKMMKKAKDRKSSVNMGDLNKIGNPADLDEIIGYWNTV